MNPSWACGFKSRARRGAQLPGQASGLSSPRGIYPAARQRAQGNSVFSVVRVPPGAQGGGRGEAEGQGGLLLKHPRLEPPEPKGAPSSSNHHSTSLVRTLFNAFRSLFSPPPTHTHRQRGSPRLQPLSPYAVTRTRVCSHSHPHTDTLKHTRHIHTRGRSACGIQKT